MPQESLWCKRYQSVGDAYLFGKAPNQFLASKESLFEPKQNALCIADGEGRNSVWLAEKGLDVSAFDLSPVAISKAKKLADDRQVKVSYQQLDMMDASFPDQNLTGTFDWVIGIFIQFTDPITRARQFESIKQLTRQGGRVLIQGYTPKQIEYKTGGPPNIENLYTKPMLESYFHGWKIETLNEYESVIDEGPGHQGVSALISLIAQKP